jgi:DNA repair protein REV1
LKPLFPSAIQSPSKPSSSTNPTAVVPDYAAHDSNPNAQRVMANPSWRSAHTSAAPDFIQGFYKNSRLHHLSAWKAELKGLVAEALVRAERNSTPGEWIADGGVTTEQGEEGVSMKGAELVMRSPKAKGKAKEIEAEDRVIMHCDFDSFFVSAGLVDRPQLRGKPVVVCHSQGAQGGGSSTSEIASSSYEARALGIKNGMRY